MKQLQLMRWNQGIEVKVNLRLNVPMESHSFLCIAIKFYKFHLAPFEAYFGSSSIQFSI